MWGEIQRKKAILSANELIENFLIKKKKKKFESNSNPKKWKFESDNQRRKSLHYFSGFRSLFAATIVHKPEMLFDGDFFFFFDFHSLFYLPIDQLRVFLGWRFSVHYSIMFGFYDRSFFFEIKCDRKKKREKILQPLEKVIVSFSFWIKLTNSIATMTTTMMMIPNLFFFLTLN